MATVSQAQQATGRRRLGRLMVAKGQQISVSCGDMKSSPDLQHLSSLEREAFNKQMAVLQKVVGNLAKLGQRLEGE